MSSLKNNKTCALLEQYLSYLTVVKGRSLLTSHEYRIDCLLFLEYIKRIRGISCEVIAKRDFSDVDIDFIKSITVADMYSFITYCGTERNVTAATRGRKIVSIRQFWKYLKTGAMVLHFKTFEVFFKLYASDLSGIQKAVLKETLEKLYAKFNITWDTDVSNLSREDFPTFKDLHGVLKEQIEKAEKKEDLEYLSIIIRELAYGSDSFLWNGHTTINPKSGFICLDTHALKDCSASTKAAQYYNALGWAWEQMSRDRNEKILLVADEAHLLCDPNTPQSLIDCAKRSMTVWRVKYADRA